MIAFRESPLVQTGKCVIERNGQVAHVVALEHMKYVYRLGDVVILSSEEAKKLLEQASKSGPK